MSTIESAPKMLSQRELRNESSRVLREVQEGQTFIVTTHGTPVARLSPHEEALPSLKITRPARRKGGWRKLMADRREYSPTLIDSLEDLRQDRI